MNTSFGARKFNGLGRPRHPKGWYESLMGPYHHGKSQFWGHLAKKMYIFDEFISCLYLIYEVGNSDTTNVCKYLSVYLSYLGVHSIC
jgi:hypothetical protein